MESTSKAFIRVRELVLRGIRGQTLSEYTLVLVAVAVACIGAYLALGDNVGALANGVDSTVSNS
jgi:Flp pilus assembly pilin Flp